MLEGQPYTILPVTFNCANSNFLSRLKKILLSEISHSQMNESLNEFTYMTKLIQTETQGK